MATLQEIRNSVVYKEIEKKSDDDLILLELDKLANNLNTRFQVNESTLRLAFVWYDTPQGHNYWSKFSYKGL